MSQNLSLAKNPIIDRIGADPMNCKWKIYRFNTKKINLEKKEEKSLRQELSKQARRLDVIEKARGSPSIGRLCPGSGNLSFASSGRLVLACAFSLRSPRSLSLFNGT